MTALEIWCLMNIIFVFQVYKMNLCVNGGILVLVIYLMPPLLQALLAYVVILVRSKVVIQLKSSV